MMAREHARVRVPTVIQQQDDEYDRVHDLYYAAQDRIDAAKSAATAAAAANGDENAKSAINDELAAAEAAFHPIQQAFLTNREHAMPTDCYQVIGSYLDRLSRARLAECDHHLHDYAIYGNNSGAAVWREGDELEKAYARKAKYGLSDTMTPLLHACREAGAVCVVRALIVAKANTQARSERGLLTALHHACERGHEQMVDVLLDAGADVCATTRFRESPLYCASTAGHLSVVHRLLAAGARVNDDGGGGDPPLRGASCCQHVEVVVALLAARANVNHVDAEGGTALHDAAGNDSEDMIPILVAAGASIDPVDHEGNTPLMVACRHNHFESATLLIAAGADPNVANNDNSSPLIVARREGYHDLVTILLAATPAAAAATAAHDIR